MNLIWRRWGAWLVALLAVASSAIGVMNGFTYDDRYIVELNPAVRNLHRWWTAFGASYWPREWGGDGYRPLTILAYKLETAMGGGIPGVFHAVNILLYVLASVLVYRVARRVLPDWAAWLAAALFAVHPVHVEAVAGVVGQSELIVAVSVLGALLLYLRDQSRRELRPRTAIGIALLYAIACFAKEHGIVLPALLVAAELTIIDSPLPLAERVRRIRPLYLGLAAIAIGFMGVRSLVLADHGIGGFQPFTPFSTLHITSGQRVLTALGVVPEWFRLLYWPAHLSSEYGPPDVAIAQGPGIAQLPGVLLLVGTLALGVLLRRRRPAASFGIAVACITLLPSSNFLIPAGIVLAERTLFLPSVGAMLVAGAFAQWLGERVRARVADTRRVRVAAVTLCGVLLLTGAVRSSDRTTVWRSNERLFNQAVVDSPLAYRAHYMLGAWSFEQLRFRTGEAEYRRALSLFPYDPYLSFNMAEQYRKIGLCGAAIPFYQWTFGLDSLFSMGHTAFSACLLKERRYAEARAEAFRGLQAGAPPRLMRFVIRAADSARVADTARGSVRGAGSPVALTGGRGKLPESMQKAARSGARQPVR